LRSHVAFMPL